MRGGSPSRICKVEKLAQSTHFQKHFTFFESTPIRIVYQHSNLKKADITLNHFNTIE